MPLLFLLFDIPASNACKIFTTLPKGRKLTHKEFITDVVSNIVLEYIEKVAVTLRTCNREGIGARQSSQPGVYGTETFAKENRKIFSTSFPHLPIRVPARNRR